MGCVASRLEEEEEEVVSVCRERKLQMKLAVKRRAALAEAHCRYCQSLYAVSAAIKLFVARHSSPASPFLITLPPAPPSSPPAEQKVITNPMFLQQKPSESTTHEDIACESCMSSISSDSSEEETNPEVEREEQRFRYFYMQMPPMSESPQGDFGWDFFNPFDTMRPEIISSYRSTEDDLKVVREEEGIPELEEEEEGGGEEEEKEVVVLGDKGKLKIEKCGVDVVEVEEGSGNGVQVEQKGLTVIDNPDGGRELLEALEDIQDYFIRAYDSGKDVSRMLEANRIYFQPGLERKGGTLTTLLLFFMEI